MKKPAKTKSAKPQIKVRDLKSRKDAKGGVKTIPWSKDG
jgi:hypothetical protein